MIFLLPLDLMITLTYVIMDNFYPCFNPNTKLICMNAHVMCVYCVYISRKLITLISLILFLLLIRDVFLADIIRLLMNRERKIVKMGVSFIIFFINI